MSRRYSGARHLEVMIVWILITVTRSQNQDCPLDAPTMWSTSNGENVAPEGTSHIIMTQHGVYNDVTNFILVNTNSTMEILHSFHVSNQGSEEYHDILEDLFYDGNDVGRYLTQEINTRCWITAVDEDVCIYLFDTQLPQTFMGVFRASLHRPSGEVDVDQISVMNLCNYGDFRVQNADGDMLNNEQFCGLTDDMSRGYKIRSGLTYYLSFHENPVLDTGGYSMIFAMPFVASGPLRIECGINSNIEADDPTAPPPLPQPPPSLQPPPPTTRRPIIGLPGPEGPMFSTPSVRADDDISTTIDPVDQPAKHSDENTKEQLSPELIAVIVLVIIFIPLLIGVLIFFILRKRYRKKLEQAKMDYPCATTPASAPRSPYEEVDLPLASDNSYSNGNTDQRQSLPSNGRSLRHVYEDIDATTLMTDANQRNTFVRQNTYETLPEVDEQTEYSEIPTDALKKLDRKSEQIETLDDDYVIPTPRNSVKVLSTEILNENKIDKDDTDDYQTLGNNNKTENTSNIEDIYSKPNKQLIRVANMVDNDVYNSDSIHETDAAQSTDATEGAVDAVDVGVDKVDDLQHVDSVVVMVDNDAYVSD